MFLGLEWYWWLAIILVIVSIPFKLKFMKRWNTRKDKWGDEE